MKTEGWAQTCPMQLRLPRVLQVWLKSSSSQRGREEPVLPMQSRLSRLRLLENSLRDGRQLKKGKTTERRLNHGKHNEKAGGRKANGRSVCARIWDGKREEKNKNKSHG